MSYRIALAAILIVFAATGILYSTHTPLFEAPDEAAHFVYAHNLLETRRLPRIEGEREMLFQTFNVEVHQPPLYYLLLAAVIAPFNRDALPGTLEQTNPFAAIGVATGNNANVFLHPPQHDIDLVRAVWAARLLSLLLGCVTVWAVYRVGALVWEPRVGLVAAGLTASLPTFIHISSSINNDNITNTVYALGILTTLALWKQREITRQDIITLGLLLPAAALSKTTGLTLYGVVGGALIMGMLTRRFAVRRVLVTAGWLMLASVLLAGWWYARNYALYGDPLAVEAAARLWSRGVPTNPSWFEIRGIWTSFWMTLGHFNVPAPAWLMPYGSVITGIGLVGVLWGTGRYPETRWTTLYLVGVCLLMAAALFAATRRINVSQGRLLYPALAAFSPIIVIGWRTLLGRWLFVLPVIPITVVALLAPFIALRPAYPTLTPVETLPADARLNAYAESLATLAYHVDLDPVKPGDPIPVDVIFRGSHPENPVFFMKAVHPLTGEILGGVDTYPGMSPTDALSGDLYRFSTVLRLNTPAAGYAPFQIEFAFGWRTVNADDPGIGRYLAWQDANGVPLGGVFAPGPAYLDPDYAPPPVTHPLDVRFGEHIYLRGYDMQATGDVLNVRLWWEPTAPIPDDWTLTVGLANDETGTMLTQQDAPPAGYPTSAWIPSVRFTTDYILKNTPTATRHGDRVSLRVGWYSPIDFERLPVHGRPNLTRDNLLYIPLP